LDFITIIFVAFALSMDAFAVSLCFGTSVCDNKTGMSLKAGAFFGIFQMLMPLIGWGFGFILKSTIQQVDHWIVFSLLTIIGSRMVIESFKNRNCQRKYNTGSIWVMLSLSVATSLDALAVGLSFALLKIPILIAISIIGVITFIMSYFGVHIGKKLSFRLGSKAEIIGGFILIGIGLKVLIEHLYYHY
jgi:manganese efflux pump family protein